MLSRTILGGLLAAALLVSPALAGGQRSSLTYQLVMERHELTVEQVIIEEPVRRIVRTTAKAALYVGERGQGVLGEARRFIGTNPTGMRHNWCAVFVNGILERTGHRTSGSARAVDFAHYGPHLPGPVPGSIAVMRHHVGFVEGTDDRGNIIVLSGNHGHTTGEGVYSRRQVIAYVMPSQGLSN